MRLARWITIWLVVSGIIQTYDACFVLTKPLSDVGGPLGFLWPGHHLYATYDGRYATFDAFGSAQSWANLVEVLLIVWVVINRKSQRGVIGALIVCVATFWKTVIYFLVELCGHMNFTKHVLDAGNLRGFVGIILVPNGVWIVLPGLAIAALARALARQLARQHA